MFVKRSHIVCACRSQETRTNAETLSLQALEQDLAADADRAMPQKSKVKHCCAKTASTALSAGEAG